MEKSKNRIRAEQLAQRSYRPQLVYDETQKGKPIYLAVHPELDGCMAQGETPAQAQDNLVEARIDYIESLLDDNLEVPLPEETPTSTSGSVGNIEEVTVFLTVEGTSGIAKGKVQAKLSSRVVAKT